MLEQEALAHNAQVGCLTTLGIGTDDTARRGRVRLDAPARALHYEQGAALRAPFADESHRATTVQACHRRHTCARASCAQRRRAYHSGMAFRQIPVPFLQQPVGLGDAVQRAAQAVGAPHCGGCEQRRIAWNGVQFVPVFVPPQAPAPAPQPRPWWAPWR